jgi:hypothetical protein
MRHLFLPACFCLMTLSGSSGPDSAASLESFSGSEANDATALAQAAERTAVRADVRVAVPAAVAVALAESVSVADVQTVPPPQAVIVVPTGILAELTIWPTIRPVYEATVAVGEPLVVLTVVDGSMDAPPNTT